MEMENGLYVIGAIAVLWFVARSGFGQKGRSSGLLGMFKREKALPRIGMGPEALKTLLDDLKSMEAQDACLRGLILAGPFAAKTAKADSIVTCIALCTDMERYTGRNWLARFPYIARGHLVQDFKSDAIEGGILHHLRLRGAPPLALYVVEPALAKPPAMIMARLQEGAIALATGTSDAKTALARWQNSDDASDSSHKGEPS